MSMRKVSSFSTKILIDIDEYQKLISLRDHLNKQEDKINARLEKEAIPNSAESSKTLQEKYVPEQSVEQSGSGSTSHHSPISDNLIKSVTELVTKQLQSQFQLIPLQHNSQEGSGANDLISQFPEPIDDNVDKPVDVIPTTSTVHKSDLSGHFEDENLMKLVPNKFKEKAKSLLIQLQKHPSDITWTSNGTIFLGQNSLPNSNIFYLFPKLFKPVTDPEKTIYLSAIATTIATLGLGKYINQKLISGLTRRAPLSNSEQLKTKIQSTKHWYYLGP